jgi:hypothetical protein
MRHAVVGAGSHAISNVTALRAADAGDPMSYRRLEPVDGLESSPHAYEASAPPVVGLRWH